MRRRRESFLSGLFFNTGNYNLPTVNDSFGYSRQFIDTVNQEMLAEERIEMEHKKAAAHEAEEHKDEQADKPVENPDDLPEAK